MRPLCGGVPTGSNPCKGFAETLLIVVAVCLGCSLAGDAGLF